MRPLLMELTSKMEMKAEYSQGERGAKEKGLAPSQSKPLRSYQRFKGMPSFADYKFPLLSGICTSSTRGEIISHDSACRSLTFVAKHAIEQAGPTRLLLHIFWEDVCWYAASTQCS